MTDLEKRSFRRTFITVRTSATVLTRASGRSSFLSLRNLSQVVRVVARYAFVVKTLQGKIAVVAGATRGAGRGIAVELGAAGATVICTGRSTRGNASDLNRLETIDETAQLVTNAGGIGIPIRVDHTQELEVKALFERVKLEHGRLDVLVNDIWGGEKLVEWGKRFWELELAQAWKLIERSIFTHVITSRYGVPLMLSTGAGLVLEITDGAGDDYRGNLVYDFIKNGVIRLAKAMAADLAGGTMTHDENAPEKPSARITVAALTPGFLRSEEMLEHFGVTESNWRDGAKKDPNFIASETPHYIGRAVAALAADPNVLRFAGQALSSWGLSEIYEFTDLDGSKPHWGRHFSSLIAKESSS
jgi:NAD(P)-dependent dehydrogenase (short-subunit alcohol dehydrogenase family)